MGRPSRPRPDSGDVDDSGDADAQADQPRRFLCPPQLGIMARLLLCCPEVCSPETRRRRAAALKIRSTRDKIAQLRQQARMAVDQSAPLAHLQAAEQHLVAVERWLNNDKLEVSDLKPQPLEADIEMAVGFGAPSDEDQQTFLEQFSPVDKQERLVTRNPCSVLASGFYYTGHLFLSSSRMCFHSHIMGVQARFSVPWGDLLEILLAPADCGRTKLAGHGHAVRASLRAPTNFNGEEVQKLNLRVFSPSALGHLHRCATVFTGSGLFGEGPAKRPSLNLMRSRSFESPGRVLRADSRGADTFLTAQDIEQQTTIWQLERRLTAFHDVWRSPFLPHDFPNKNCKWVTLDQRYHPHPLLPKGLSPEMAAASAVPPVPELEILGGVRTCTWKVVINESTDKEGWQYAVDFYVGDQLWQPSVGPFVHVRRRRWKPEFSTKPEDTEETGSPVRVDSWEDVEALFQTTILAQKGLSEKAGVVQKVFETEFDDLALDTLASTLMADDWSTEGELMAIYFREAGMQDLMIGPWATGPAAAQVKGKVRSIEMRAPVPPAPMCPKETRCASTWHVVSEPSRVVLESVIMSLDVPYGDSFDVVSCDTFTLDPETGRTRMETTCGVDWVKSCWMKNLVEVNVPKEIAKVGEVKARAVRQYMEHRAMSPKSSLASV